MILDWIRRAMSSKPDDLEKNDRTTNHDSHESMTSTLPLERADHWLGEGNIALNAGNYMQALSAYKQAARAAPDNATVHYLVSEAYRKQGAMEDCEDSLKLAIHLDPAQYDACLSLGNIYLERNENENAASMYLKALEGINDNAELYCNLGLALFKQGRNSETENYFRKSLSLDRDNAVVLNNLAVLLFEEDRTQEAFKLVQHAISISPEYEQANKTYVSALRELGRTEEALAHVDKALSVNDTSAAMHWQKSLVLLSMGQCEQGWIEYEWGLKTTERKIRKCNIRRWKDEEISEKGILARAEQGIGDEIRLASCIPDLIKTAGHVFVECDQRLVGLYERSFPAATIIGITRTSPPIWDQEHSFDFEVPLASLPLHFRPTVESFPVHSGYLVVDAHQQACWQERLALLGSGPKIGVAWRSRLNTGIREKEYIRLSDLSPVLKIPGVHFVNLQYDECTDELAEAFQSSGVRITDFTELDQFNDIDGVAALMSALDLVITVGVTVGELAGALGRPVWKLSRKSNWTMLGTDASPWYPATRIFIQENVGDWSGPVGRIASLLKNGANEWHNNYMEGSHTL